MSGLAASSLFALTESEALALAERRRLPCFAYRLDIAGTRYDALRAALPERALLAYAIKANPGRELIAAFAAKGSAFDCASIGELELVRDASVPGFRVLLAGPGKSLDELRLALAMGARIQVDGIEDIERIDAILAEGGGQGGGPALAVSLRVHPLSGVSEASRIIGGSGPSAFGVDEEDLPSFLREAARFPRIAIAGLQVFAASNERDSERLLANHRAAFAIGELMQKERGKALDQIDVGGGLGIPYAEGEAELDIGAFGAGLARLLEANDWFSGRLIVEPGRWLAGPCGVYLARVVRAKRSRGERFAVLEGGINHLLRPLLTGQGFPASAPRAKSATAISEASGEAGAAPVAQTLAGPLCTSLDRLGLVELPELRAGDLVMLGQAGAYGFTEAMGAFLSHPAPDQYWLEGAPPS